jgi:hypothetical protein
MQTLITIAIIVCLGLIVIVGFLRVLGDLLAIDFGGPPSLSEHCAEFSDELSTGNAKTAIVTTVATIARDARG